MAMHATPEDRVARVQAALRETLGKENPAVLGLQQAPRPPKVLNVEQALNLDAPVRFMYRGQGYEATHVPHADGIALAEIHYHFAEAADKREDVAVLRGLLVQLRRAVAIFYRLSRPVLPHARFWYRIGPNPFVRASEAEVLALLHFFSRGRMHTNGISTLVLSADQRP